MAKKRSKKATSKKPQAKANAKAAGRPGIANKLATAKRSRATPTMKDGITAENRAQVATMVDRHANALQELRGQVAQ